MSERERVSDLLCEQAVFPYKSMERQAKLRDTSGDKPGHTRDEATHTHAGYLITTCRHRKLQSLALYTALRAHTLTCSQLADDGASRG